MFTNVFTNKTFKSKKVDGNFISHEITLSRSLNKEWWWVKIKYFDWRTAEWTGLADS